MTDVMMPDGKRRTTGKGRGRWRRDAAATVPTQSGGILLDGDEQAFLRRRDDENEDEDDDDDGNQNWLMARVSLSPAAIYVKSTVATGLLQKAEGNCVHGHDDDSNEIEFAFNSDGSNASNAAVLASPVRQSSMTVTGNRYPPLRRPIRYNRFFVAIATAAVLYFRVVGPPSPPPPPPGADGFDKQWAQYRRRYPHVIPPKAKVAVAVSDLTLRHFLQAQDDELPPPPYAIAMAPAFFGFYGYFGALWGLQESLSPHYYAPSAVAGASAGALAAILLAANVAPPVAADFGVCLTLRDIADGPGLLSLFRGNRWERLMHDFLQQHGVTSLMQHAPIPVAVTAFDLVTLQRKVLTRGSMARAARASATFPLLFQPVSGDDDNANGGGLLVDGGIMDVHGIEGLRALLPTAGHGNRTVINLVVGSFLGDPPGPDGLEHTSTMISISLQHLPRCGPWAMHNGAATVQAAKAAVVASLDVPLLVRARQHDANTHYELHLDTRPFWKQQ